MRATGVDIVTLQPPQLTLRKILTCAAFMLLGFTLSELGMAIRETIAVTPLDHFISDGYSFLVEMLYEASQRGSRIGEVPITFAERREGESKLSRAVLLESAITPWRLVASRRSARPTAR